MPPKKQAVKAKGTKTTPTPAKTPTLAKAKTPTSAKAREMRCSARATTREKAAKVVAAAKRMRRMEQRVDEIDVAVHNVLLIQQQQQRQGIDP